MTSASRLDVKSITKKKKKIEQPKRLVGHPSVFLTKTPLPSTWFLPSFFAQYERGSLYRHFSPPLLITTSSSSVTLVPRLFLRLRSPAELRLRLSSPRCGSRNPLMAPRKPPGEWSRSRRLSLEEERLWLFFCLELVNDLITRGGGKEYNDKQRKEWNHTAHVFSPTHSHRSPPPTRLPTSRARHLQSRVPAVRPPPLQPASLRFPWRGSSLGDVPRRESRLRRGSASHGHRDGGNASIVSGRRRGRRWDRRPKE